MKKAFLEFSNRINTWVFAFFPISFSIFYSLKYGSTWQESNVLIGLYFGVVILGTLLLGYWWSLFTIKLKIDETGITFRYLSWQFKSVHYDWHQIRSAGIVAFEPKQDFHGWGIKTSDLYGKGYLTKGKTGLLVELMNGEKMMMSVIDTEKAAEILQVYTPKSYTL